MPQRAALIALLIVERPLCIDCIAERAHLLPPEVQGYFDLIRDHLAVFHEDSDRCRACGIVGKVFSLDRLPL